MVFSIWKALFLVYKTEKIVLCSVRQVILVYVCMCSAHLLYRQESAIRLREGKEKRGEAQGPGENASYS